MHTKDLMKMINKIVEIAGLSALIIVGGKAISSVIDAIANLVKSTK